MAKKDAESEVLTATLDPDKELGIRYPFPGVTFHRVHDANGRFAGIIAVEEFSKNDYISFAFFDERLSSGGQLGYVPSKAVAIEVGIEHLRVNRAHARRFLAR
jgi:hypothetical protein